MVLPKVHRALQGVGSFITLFARCKYPHTVLKAVFVARLFLEVYRGLREVGIPQSLFLGP